MRLIPQRLAALTVTSVGVLLAGALPASAATETPDWDPPYPYSLLETLGLFVGIPLLVFAIVILAVYAPGLSKSRKEQGTEAVWETSPAGAMSAPSGPGIITPSGPTDHTEPGGASARW